MSNNVLLYGANGYTAKLILAELLKSRIDPILAGRNETEIRMIAEENKLAYRIFSLTNHNEILKGLDDITILVNCAGPFSKTAGPLLKACLERRIHYIDITGEIAVFKLAHSYDEQAKEQGIIICPGLGFDVVPTDCLALLLKEQFGADANNLELAFHAQGGASKGTALTSFAGSGNGTKIRRDGKIISAPFGKYQKDIKFPHKTLRVNSIPWGDVFTSYISTGIPNVTVYIVMHPKTIKRMQRFQRLFFLGRIQPFKWFITKQIKKSIPQGGGPNTEVRSKTFSYIWGNVSDTQGKSLTYQLKTINGYDLTAIGTTLAVKKIESIKDKKGYFTPSLLFGSNFILEIPGSELIKS